MYFLLITDIVLYWNWFSFIPRHHVSTASFYVPFYIFQLLSRRSPRRWNWTDNVDRIKTNGDVVRGFSSKGSDDLPCRVGRNGRGWLGVENNNQKGMKCLCGLFVSFCFGPGNSSASFISSLLRHFMSKGKPTFVLSRYLFCPIKARLWNLFEWSFPFALQSSPVLFQLTELQVTTKGKQKGFGEGGNRERATAGEDESASKFSISKQRLSFSCQRKEREFNFY